MSRFAIPVENDDGRNIAYGSESPIETFVIANDSVIYVPRLDEGLDVLGWLVQRDADNLEFLMGEVVSQGDQNRDFFEAGSAPGCPIDNERHFALASCGPNGLAFDADGLPLLRGLIANYDGWFAAIRLGPAEYHIADYADGAFVRTHTEAEVGS